MKNTHIPPYSPIAWTSNPQLQFLGILGGLLIVLFIVQLLSGKRHSGKTARAEFATSRQIANSERVAKKMLANPKPTNFAYYVTEPIGRPVPPPHKLGDFQVGNNISYFTRANSSTLVVGGAGSGKTVNFINPAVLSAIKQGAAIVYYDYKFPDKNQSLPIIAAALKEGYQVRILAPGQDFSQCFNLVDLIPDDTAMSKASEIIDVMALNYFESAPKKDYFDRSGANIASGSLLLAKWVARAAKRPELANLLMASQILALDKLPLRLIENRHKLNPWTYKAFDGLTSIQSGKEVNKQQVGVIGTAQEIFKKSTAIEMIPALCGASTLPLFDPKDPLKIDGKVLLVLGVEKGLAESILPAFATIIHQLLAYNLDAKRPRKTPLIFVDDEAFTNKVPWLLKAINQERGSGFCGIFGVQYLGQLKSAYGADGAQGFEASCANSLWFGTGDFEMCEHVSKKLGEKEIILDSESQSNSTGKSGASRSKSTNEQRHKIRLLEPQELHEFPPGKAVIFTPGVGNGKEIKVPYIHQFKYDGAAADAASDEAQNIFQQLSKALVAANPPKDNLYYSKLLDEYNQILEELLPLSDKKDDKFIPPPSKFSINGRALIDALLPYKKEVSNIDPDRKYPVPEKLLDGNGKLLLSLENCLYILGGKNE